MLKKLPNQIRSGLKKFYTAQDGIAEKMYWTIIPLTGVMGVFSVLGTILEGLGPLAVSGGLLCIANSFLFLLIGHRHPQDCAENYAWFILVFNCLIFPFTVLANGGLHSGMPVYCLGMVLLGAFCIGKVRRTVVTTISISAYTVLLLLCKKYPVLVNPIREEFVDYDVILSFFVAAISVSILISKGIEEVDTQRFEDVNDGMIDSLGTVIEFRSLETGNHVQRIKKYMEILLKNANECITGADFSREEIRVISSAVVLHDIGKIAVPDSILNKPDRLTAEEFEEIKKHPLAGCRIIETMRDFQNKEYFDYCYEICRHHHERWDGKGYPDGLKGDEIPLVSQVAAAADVFDALTSERVYKKAFTPKTACKVMEENRGQFSPQMINCLWMSLPQLKNYVWQESSEQSTSQEAAEELELVRSAEGPEFRLIQNGNDERKGN